MSSTNTEAKQLSSALALSSQAGPRPSREEKSVSISQSEIDALRELTSKYGQSHVWTHWNTLSPEEQQILVQDIKHLDLPELTRTFETVGKTNTDSTPAPVITPFSNVSHLASQTSTTWYNSGLDLLAKGKVAVLLMAGGQGTRLGSSDPKGCYDIGLPSHKSLFAIQAERLVRLHALAASHANVPVSSVSIPWYIMTSIITDTPTRAFFVKNNYFGINPKDIYFFQQAELPALTNDGKIILEKKYKLALSPNGNGGIFDALKKSGSLADMKKRGIEYIHVYGVDNVLVKIADPTLIGFHAASGTPITNKVVLKTDPKERVGVMCYRNGRPSVVEYSEIPESVSASRNDKGELLYSAGNIAQHVFTLSFLDHLEKTPLQYHVARKAIPYIDEHGVLVTPKSPNGIKLELFVFDIFEMTDSISCFAVPRESEFSPVKNAVAQGVIDSPETARIHLSQYHASLVRHAGGIIQGEPDATHSFEICGLISYQGEGLEERVKGQTFTLPYHLH